MELFRLCAGRWATTAFSGEGASRYPARWHHRGTRVVYTATHPALAVLELLVHVDWDTAPNDLVLIAAAVPDEAVEHLPRADLPPDWDAVPESSSTRDLGTAWAASGRSLALAVPSAVVPGALNVLLNPAHPRFAEVTLGPPRPFTLDPRLPRPA